MKARLIKNPKKGLILLCEDGTIMQPDKKKLHQLLYQILTSAKKTGVTFGNGEAGRWTDEYPEMTLYPGKDIACIADSGEVILFDFTPFAPLVAADFKAQNLMSVPEYAVKMNASEEMVKVYCRQGRLRGVVKTAGNWLIPADAEWPIDPERRRIGQNSGPRKRKPKTDSK